MFCKTTDNLNIYFEVQGNENAKETLVFLNGLSQSTVSWILTTPHFKNDYKIVLIDSNCCTGLLVVTAYNSEFKSIRFF